LNESVHDPFRKELQISQPIKHRRKRSRRSTIDFASEATAGVVRPMVKYLRQINST
jgi:hypothetical protein